MLRSALMLGGAAAILGSVIAPAQALSTDTWYAAAFTSTGSSFYSAYNLGTSPPSWRPWASANAGTAPYTFTLAHPEELVITDVEASGDQFTLTFTGATTGTVTTSNPTYGHYVGECISCALGDSFFSHGYYWLNAGTTTIYPTFDGTVGYGDVDFSVGTSTPEASTWAMMGLGFVGLAFAGYRSRRPKTAIA